MNRVGNRLILESPFAVENFTFRIAQVKGAARLDRKLEKVSEISGLAAGTWWQGEQTQTVCINLQRGQTVLQWDQA